MNGQLVDQQASAPPWRTRRRLWLTLAGLAGLGTATLAGLFAYLWPEKAAAEIDVGPVSAFPMGTVRHFQVSQPIEAQPPRSVARAHLLQARDFHLVRRPDGFVAFWHRCTHRGCAVPYRPEFEVSGQKGVFRCPCHGSTYSREEGEIIFGPAPRSLDTLPVRIHGGRVLVTVAPGRERQRAWQEPARVAQV